MNSIEPPGGNIANSCTLTFKTANFSPGGPPPPAPGGYASGPPPQGGSYAVAGAGTQPIADSAWMLSGAGQASIETLPWPIKKESRGDVGTYSPQPVARVRPLPTCTRCDPCGQLRGIVRLGSGLTANRENRPTPRDSILLSASSRSPQPALRC